MRKQIAAGILSTATLLSISAPLSMMNSTVFAATTYLPQLKSISLDGQPVNHPYGIVVNNTTYMPIWYVMQVLKQMNIENSWDGTHWSLTAPSSMSVDLSHVPSTQGAKTISLNGNTLYRVDSIAFTDPSSHALTTYMPIWYVQQVLDRLGIHSTWDGQTWGLSTPSVPSGATSDSASVKYTIQSGDSLWKISQKFDIPVSAIAAQNGLDSADTIYTGQVISIPQQPVNATSAPVGEQTQSAPSNPQAAGGATRGTLAQHIVTTAEKYMGPVPYVWGGNSPSGWDCSGFTTYVFEQNGVTLPRVSHDQATVGTAVDESQLEPGDLVFFGATTSATAATNTVSHVGIYIGNGNFIHESSSQNAVICSSLSNTYWAGHYDGARRVF